MRPKYHRYVWMGASNPGIIGKLVEQDISSIKSFYCPQANETAKNKKFKISTYLDRNGKFIPENDGDATRSPYIFLPVKGGLKGIFIDKLDENDFLIGSTFLSSREIFHEQYGARWNAGLVNGTVLTARAKSAWAYVQSNYVGNDWPKADKVRDLITPK